MVRSIENFSCLVALLLIALVARLIFRPMVSDQPGRQKAIRPRLLDEAPERPLVQGEASESTQLGHRQGQVLLIQYRYPHRQGLAPELRQADYFKSKPSFPPFLIECSSFDDDHPILKFNAESLSCISWFLILVLSLSLIMDQNDCSLMFLTFLLV